ncbi:hypothetical protein GCM10010245_22460 [Streptomyces spectabilis]|nr:hypothetical protein GCM10010245_22460 [Streptomyces spectabilis]
MAVVGSSASRATVRWVTPAAPSRAMTRTVASMSARRRRSPLARRPSVTGSVVGPVAGPVIGPVVGSFRVVLPRSCARTSPAAYARRSRRRYPVGARRVPHARQVVRGGTRFRSVPSRVVVSA